MSMATLPKSTPKPPPAPEDVPDGYELVDGKLRRLPMATLSAWIETRVFRLVDEHCLAEKFGIAFQSSAAYNCFPSKPTQVRRPDVSVIAGDPTTYVPPAEGILQVVPLLVVEVVSPRERVTELMRKVNDFRSAGTPLIWVIVPSSRQATIYRADGSVSLITDPAELSGEGVLPGFTMPLATVLPPATAEPAPNA